MSPGWPERSRLRKFFVWDIGGGVAWLYITLVHRWWPDTREALPVEGPLLYVANHQSFLDPPMVGLQCKSRPAAFLARKTLFDNPLFGRLLRFLNSIPLDYAAGARAFRAAIDELNAGRCVLIFPEGARCRDGATHEFKPGVMLLIRRCKPTIVPVAVEGCFDALPMKGRPRFGAKTVSRIGTPIPAAELLALDTPAALDRMRRAVEEIRLELRAELRAASGGTYPAPGPGDRPYWEREAETSPDGTADSGADTARAADTADTTADAAPSTAARD
ncbi:MAG: lysophospholipid acyltransferase family protein [Phycisphaerales bacterium]